MTVLSPQKLGLLMHQIIYYNWDYTLAHKLDHDTFYMRIQKVCIHVDLMLYKLRLCQDEI